MERRALGILALLLALPVGLGQSLDMTTPVIATLTMNPAIALSYEVDAVSPTQKLRTRSERHFPGGGGINVARVLARLGRSARHASGAR
jgi:hypothetical protein